MDMDQSRKLLIILFAYCAVLDIGRELCISFHIKHGYTRLSHTDIVTQTQMQIDTRHIVPQT